MVLTDFNILEIRKGNSYFWEQLTAYGNVYVIQIIVIRLVLNLNHAGIGHIFVVFHNNVIVAVIDALSHHLSQQWSW